MKNEAQTAIGFQDADIHYDLYRLSILSNCIPPQWIFVYFVAYMFSFDF